MGNLFIGFPVPRAKIATMIEEAAPPLEHYQNHEPDGSDPIVLPGDISENQNVQWNGEKFVGADPAGNGVYPSPISIPASDFQPLNDNTDYYCDTKYLLRRSSLASAQFFAPVFLPHGVTVTKLTLYAFRNDALAGLTIILYRVSNSAVETNMAQFDANWTNGIGSGYDDSINNPIIDNNAYSYTVKCLISPNDSTGDVKILRVQIAFS